MAFDPDQYLAEKSAPPASDGFDPDAYLSSKTAPAAPQGFLERQGRNLVNNLPLMGGILGGAIGTPADVIAGPMGTVAGAGIGGALGASAKNLINHYIDPDNAPKTTGQALLDPLVAGGEQAGMQAGGELAAPILSYGAGKITAPVADYLAKLAEKKALQATGATAAQVTNKFAPDAGRQLLDRGLVGFGDTQKSIAKKAAAALDQSGQGIGKALSDLDEKGASVPTSDIISKLRAKAAALGKDPSSFGVADSINKLADRLESESSKRTASKIANQPWLDPAGNAADIIPGAGVQDQLPLPSREIQPDMFRQETPPGALPSIHDLRSTPMATGPEIQPPLRSAQSIEQVVPANGPIGQGTRSIPAPIQGVAASDAVLTDATQPRFEFPTGSADDTVPLSAAENTKRGFQNSVNYSSPVQDQSVAKSAADAYRQAVEEAAVKADPDIASQFKQYKEDYGLLSPIQEATERRAAVNSQRQGVNFHGISKGALGAAVGGEEGYRHGGLPGALAGAAAGAFIAPRALSSAAVGTDFVGTLVKNSPQALGKWAPALTQAAARGGNSLPATDYILQQTDPEYREHLKGLQNSDQKSQDNESTGDNN